MIEQSVRSPSISYADEAAVGDLYRQLLDAWNDRVSADYAAPFAPDGFVVGFDGSQMEGPDEIETVIGQIFDDHMTARYVGKIKDVRFLSPEVAVLRAVAGLIPRGQSELNPDANAIQTLLAVKRDGGWYIAVYQNTPAQFHGRPELAKALTAELQAESASRRDG